MRKYVNAKNYFSKKDCYIVNNHWFYRYHKYNEKAIYIDVAIHEATSNFLLHYNCARRPNILGYIID